MVKKCECDHCECEQNSPLARLFNILAGVIILGTILFLAVIPYFNGH
jgi:hypothetical protein